MRLKLLPNDQLWAPEKLLRQGTKIPSGKQKRYIFCLSNKCINVAVFVNALGRIYAQKGRQKLFKSWACMIFCNLIYPKIKELSKGQ